MKSSIFVFLGLYDDISDINVETLKNRLQDEFSNISRDVAYSIKGDLLIVTFTNPDFRYYISFVNKETINEYNQLSKDFELPWIENRLTAVGSGIFIIALKRRSGQTIIQSRISDLSY
jgi:hypothetical protein